MGGSLLALAKSIYYNRWGGSIIVLLVYRSITGSDRGYKTEVLIIIALFERRFCGSSKDSREQTRRKVSKHELNSKAAPVW